MSAATASPAAYRSAEEAEAVITAALELVSADPNKGPGLASSGMSMRIEFDDIGLVLNLAGNQSPKGNDGFLRWSFSDDIDWQPDLRMTMSSEVANLYLQGKQSITVRPGSRIDSAQRQRPRCPGLPAGDPRDHRAIPGGARQRLPPSDDQLGLMGSESTISRTEAARRAGVSPQTLKRWEGEKLIPLKGGKWTVATAAQARVVARMRVRGHSLRSLRAAVRDGRLAFGYVEDLLPSSEVQISRAHRRPPRPVSRSS